MIKDFKTDICDCGHSLSDHGYGLDCEFRDCNCHWFRREK